MKRLTVMLGIGLMSVTTLGGVAAAQENDDDDYPEVASIAVSDATLSCPQPFTVSGDGFEPGDTVTITFDGESIGSATVDDQGEFSADVTAPDAAAGSHTVTASNSDSAKATVSCVGPAAPGVAFTGANITVGLLLLVGLVVAGAGALLLGRRRAGAQS
jgi:hypothetical protein